MDLFQIEDLLTEEQKIVKDTIKDFVQKEVLPIIDDYFERGEFPLHLVKKMANLGLFGATLKEYGGAGLDYISYGLMMQELEGGDSGLRSFVSVQNGLVIFPILEYGTKEQKEKWIPGLISGEKIGCFGLTEPDFGSNPAGMLTRAEKRGDRFILNGTKMWITNGSIADIAIIWAKYNGEIWAFLVEKEREGFSTNLIKNKFSLRASVTSELVLNDVEIPEENILPKSKGLVSALRCLNEARYSIAWGSVGSAISCLETALDYAKNRVQFSKPIAAYQLIQDKLVWMATEITKAQLLNYHLGLLKDKGIANYRQISMAKMNNVKIALECARMSREILGASGITYEYPIARHLLNLEAVKTYEGTHEIHTLIVGKWLTGLDAID